MNIFLVRHGTSKGNIDHTEYLRTPDCDIPLVEQGKIDAVNAAKSIRTIMNHLDFNVFDKQDPHYFNLVHSTYTRASETSKILHDELLGDYNLSIKNVFSSPLCVEREWGGLRNLINNKLSTVDKSQYFKFHYRPSNGESYFDVYLRAAVFHQWLLHTCKHTNTIVVAHGEFNKIYLMYLLNWDVNEFEKWNNSKNGEVFLVQNGQLSELTPLTISKYYTT